MPARIWKFRFPDGHVELRTFPTVLTEGAEVTMRGAHWIVGPITDRSVTLIPKSVSDTEVSEPVDSARPSDLLIGYVET